MLRLQGKSGVPEFIGWERSGEGSQQLIGLRRVNGAIRHCVGPFAKFLERFAIAEVTVGAQPIRHVQKRGRAVERLEPREQLQVDALGFVGRIGGFDHGGPRGDLLRAGGSGRQGVVGRQRRAVDGRQRRVDGCGGRCVGKSPASDESEDEDVVFHLLRFCVLA